jgi:hypothetical protein
MIFSDFYTCRTLDAMQKKSIPGLKDCISPDNSFSSCDDMLKSFVIQLGPCMAGKKQKQGGERLTKSHFCYPISPSQICSWEYNYLLFVAIQHTIWKGEYFSQT